VARVEGAKEGALGRLAQSAIAALGPLGVGTVFDGLGPIEHAEIRSGPDRPPQGPAGLMRHPGSRGGLEPLGEPGADRHGCGALDRLGRDRGPGRIDDLEGRGSAQPRQDPAEPRAAEACQQITRSGVGAQSSRHLYENPVARAVALRVVDGREAVYRHVGDGERRRRGQLVLQPLVEWGVSRQSGQRVDQGLDVITPGSSQALPLLIVLACDSLKGREPGPAPWPPDRTNARGGGRQEAEPAPRTRSAGSVHERLAARAAGGGAHAEIAREEAASRYQVGRALALVALRPAPAGAVRRLSLDEAHHRRGRELVTVVSDLDRRRVVEVLDGRSRRRVERYLRALPAQARAAIEVVGRRGVVLRNEGDGLQRSIVGALPIYEALL